MQRRDHAAYAAAIADKAMVGFAAVEAELRCSKTFQTELGAYEPAACETLNINRFGIW